MIGVPEAHRYFGSTIGGEVLDVLHTLGVSPERIGYFTLDNAENNDTAMEVIGVELRRYETWEVLYHLEAILAVFETVVKTLEGDGHIRRSKQGWTGSFGNIWDVVLGYELLLNTLEEYKQLAADFPDPEHCRIGINLAWDKLDEYYWRLDETPIYYTAMALHPAYRWDWFDETWAHKPSWVEKAKEMVADVWLSDYAHLEVRTSSSRGDDEPPAKRPRFFNPFEKNSRVPNSLPAHAAAIVGDEYQAWQTDRDASDGNVRDPIGYWITKQSRYPRLSRMALDFLTIQPMSGLTLLVPCWPYQGSGSIA
ncbi:hypothetical protein HZS61_005448 [Fusarium oxysporum f. sp. conglutinans]|uniref:HAT C-terminal dimerisation domain-containing protein n=2 Tax=Fusarium oxysporum TaxID=5507 RepID=A0A8H6G9U7_FUSOX|nr:hypothetical protein HZS61_005448 [Fusarium oxysporum f. sp. conglutinans]